MLFPTHKTSNMDFSSTQVSSSSYEDTLVRLLSLPLLDSSRRLATPDFIQTEAYQMGLRGEMAEFTPAWNSQVTLSPLPLNEIGSKLNCDVSSAKGDETCHDTYDANTLFQVLDNDGVNDDLCFKISSAKEEPKLDMAKLEDMPIEDQKKKGLLGLEFKIFKVVNPETQRMCTKYVCTHENCGKQCDNKWSFLDHNRHHTGFRPYVCNICSKRFTQRGNLRQHKMIHKN